MRIKLIGYCIGIFWLQSCKLSSQASLDDAFSAIDKKVWQYRTHTFANNLAYFTSDNASVSNNTLALKLTTDARGGKKLTAAEIRTKKKYTYGRFSCQMKAAEGSGIITSFFLYDSETLNHPEIDIEITGKDPGIANLAYWSQGKSISKDVDLGFKASEAFHEYVITWLPGKIIWEIDGKVVHQAEGDIPKKPMQLLLNIWASKPNGWAGQLNPTILPKQAEWRTVKIFKRTL